MDSKKPIIFKIFEILNSSGLRYTHFKSSEHLHASFEGNTDFDILVKSSDYDAFIRILIEFGFKKRESTFDKMYPVMSDYLFYDCELEQIHHFHLHTRLIIGKKYYKHYLMPHEDWLFLNSSLHPEYPISVIPIEYELFLLIFRAFLKLKLNLRTFLKCLNGNPVFEKGIQKEFDFLISMFDELRFEKIGNTLFNSLLPISVDFIKRFSSEKIGLAFLILMKIRVTRNLKFFNLDHNTTSALPKIRLFSKPYSSSWFSGGAKTIAFVGADGSGKTSSVKSITKWLNYKLSVKTYYLGRPKSGTLVSSVKFIKAICFKLPVLKSFGYSTDALFQAFYRYKSFKTALSDSTTGTIIIFDRYPLREFRKMKYPTDGPRIGNSNRLSKLELSYYDRIASYPDLIIALDVNYETSASRKAEHQSLLMRKELENKIDAIKSLCDNTSHNNIFKIDANRNQAAVLNDIKRIIWKHI